MYNFIDMSVMLCVIVWIEIFNAYVYLYVYFIYVRVKFNLYFVNKFRYS